MIALALLARFALCSCVMITLTEAAVCTGWCLSAPGWSVLLYFGVLAFSIETEQLPFAMFAPGWFALCSCVMITLTEAAVCTGWCRSAPGWRRVLFLLPSPRQSWPAHLRNQSSSEKALYSMYPSGCGVYFLGFKMGLKSALRH